ncbi:MAG: trypsin-like peptidase domain-containing protein [Caulobacteraceae bacterium]
MNAPAAGPVAGAPASFADIVAKVAPAVVSIDVEGKADPNQVAFASPFGGGGQGGQGGGAIPGLPFGFQFRQVPQQPDGRDLPKMQATGSGFFISPDGYIVTNNHVVEGADKITVRMQDGRSLKATIVGRDPATDIAVVRVEGTDFPFVSFEDRAKPRVGDWVVAVGNPYNLGGTATAGIVSALGRPNVGESSYVDYMQIDAPINRGNSGGPTFDMYGRVVGVNTAIFSPTGGSVGIGFDIPADVADGITKQLIANGKVVRGYIGATVQDVTPDIADSLGLPPKSGALVADLTPGGPSEHAGLKPGDLVQKVDGHPVTSASDLTRQVGLAHAGDDIHLTVRRDGQVRDVVVRSGVRPSEAALAQNDAQGDDSAPDEPADKGVLGMHLAPNAEGGVTIEGLSAGSDASQKGLSRGDVIMRAGDHKAAGPARRRRRRGGGQEGRAQERAAAGRPQRPPAVRAAGRLGRRRRQQGLIPRAMGGDGPAVRPFACPVRPG